MSPGTGVITTGPSLFDAVGTLNAALNVAEHPLEFPAAIVRVRDACPPLKIAKSKSNDIGVFFGTLGFGLQTVGAGVTGPGPALVLAVVGVALGCSLGARVVSGAKVGDGVGPGDGPSANIVGLMEGV